MKKVWNKILVAACLLALLTVYAHGQGMPGAGADSYRLMPKDRVSVAVFGEGDLSVTQLVDNNGNIIMPLLGAVSVRGKTVREAEELLERRFRDEEYLIDPQVTVSIVEYAVKQIYVFGEVQSPGIQRFPQDATAMDIVEVISMAGDFTNLARSTAVQVKRVDANGREEIITVNVTDLIKGSGRRGGQGAQTFLVYPDDVIYVPERIF